MTERKFLRNIHSAFIIVLATISLSAHADIIFVKPAGSGGGSNWVNAYGELQEALDAAGSGDMIWVAKGTYKPSAEAGGSGDRYKTFQMKNNVAIYGGFEGNEPNTFNLNDRDFVVNETILSGDLFGNDSTDIDPCDLFNDPNRADNCYHIFYHPNEYDLDPTAILDGFTIIAGNADSNSWPHYYGGGMYNYQSSPTVANCKFIGNTAEDGGAIANDCYSEPNICNGLFSKNASEMGGGIINHLSSPTIRSCIFSDNVANYSGGGMYNFRNETAVIDSTFTNNTAENGGAIANEEYSAPNICDCNFIGNFAELFGGAIYISFNSRPAVFDCNFKSNSTNKRGGAISIYYYSDPNITNCTFSANSSEIGAGGISNEDNCRPEITYCTFTGNTADIGGGMLSDTYSEPNIANCVFIDNQAETVGGGMSVYHFSNPVITNCSFITNSSNYAAGAISIEDNSNPKIVNSIFLKNSAVLGGGLLVDLYSTPKMTNCTLADNSAEIGGGIINNNYSHSRITNCILWDNKAPNGNNIFNYISMPIINRCNITGCGGSADWDPNMGTDGGGNIDSDPCFVDMDHNNLHLKPYSPCINIGYSSAVTEENDHEGYPRLRYGYVDMGAYEVYPIAGDVEPDEDIDFMDYAVFGYNWSKTDCNALNLWCDNCDINKDGFVDSYDLNYFTRHWLYSAQATQSAPKNLTVTAYNATQIDLEWNDNSEPDLSGYNIYRGTIPGFEHNVYTLIASTDKLTSNYSDTNLVPETTYYYKVTALNMAQNESAPSGQAFATTYDTTPPASPTSLIATTLNDSAISLNWDDNSEPDLFGYNVYLSQMVGFVPGPNTLFASGVSDSTYTVSGLNPNTTYYFKVTAVDTSDFESPSSSEASATTDAISIIPIMQGHWKFDDGTGQSTAVDSSSNGRTGTLIGMDPASDWVTGKYQDCLTFDALNDYVKISGYKGVTGKQSRTICCWIKTTSIGSDTMVSYGGIDPGAQGTSWTFRLDSGRLRVQVWTGYTIGHTPINDGQWHHVACILNADPNPNVNEIDLYIDGVLDSKDEPGNAQINTESITDVTIGAAVNPGSYITKRWFFNGEIDDVRIFDTALNNQELQAVINGDDL